MVSYEVVLPKYVPALILVLFILSNFTSGQIVIASKDSHKGLFFALKGGFNNYVRDPQCIHFLRFLSDLIGRGYQNNNESVSSRACLCMPLSHLSVFDANNSRNTGRTDQL